MTTALLVFAALLLVAIGVIVMLVRQILALNKASDEAALIRLERQRENAKTMESMVNENLRLERVVLQLKDEISRLETSCAPSTPADLRNRLRSLLSVGGAGAGRPTASVVPAGSPTEPHE